MMIVNKLLSFFFIPQQLTALKNNPGLLQLDYILQFWTLCLLAVMTTNIAEIWEQ